MYLFALATSYQIEYTFVLEGTARQSAYLSELPGETSGRVLGMLATSYNPFEAERLARVSNPSLRQSAAM